jgi:hypothetical protein
MLKKKSGTVIGAVISPGLQEFTPSSTVIPPFTKMKPGEVEEQGGLSRDAVSNGAPAKTASQSQHGRAVRLIMAPVAGRCGSAASESGGNVGPFLNIVVSGREKVRERNLFTMPREHGSG